MSNKETLEEAALNFAITIQTKEGTVSRLNAIEWFKAGAKEQAERMYSDMQEYAEFCIECDRKEMPLLLVQDWYEHYKK